MTSERRAGQKVHGTHVPVPLAHDISPDVVARAEGNRPRNPPEKTGSPFPKRGLGATLQLVHTHAPLVPCQLPRRLYFAPLVLALAIVGCGARTELKNAALDSTGASPDDPEAGAVEPEPIRCNPLSFNYSAFPATVVVLIDRSGSMTYEFGSETRWSVVRDALFSDRDGLIPRLGGTTRFGLAFYTSLDGFSGGTCPMMDYTSPVLGDVGVLRQAFDSMSPLMEGDTPTAEAVLEALDWLDQGNPSGPRYLVLITDGEPDTCALPDPQNGQAEALQAAREARDRGVEMYIVGVSSDVGESHLQQMANVAQGVRADAKWGQDAEAIEPIVASDQGNVLAGQIQGALGDVRTCSIALGEAVDPEGNFVVTLDGYDVPRSEYTVAEGQLILSGDACAEVLGDAKTLDVEVPCVSKP